MLNIAIDARKVGRYRVEDARDLIIIPWRQHVNGPVAYAAALVGIIAIMVWIVQLPFVALLINIGLIALAAWIVQGPFVALLAIVGFVAVILSALRWARDIRRHRTTTPNVGTALDVLNARYARGDIDQAEYREKRATLQDPRRARA
jgi:uncharacterized membrane protein